MLASPANHCWYETDWGAAVAPTKAGCATFSGEHAIGGKTKHCIHKSFYLDSSNLVAKAPLRLNPEDGAAHDPRYPFDPTLRCEETQQAVYLVRRKDDHNPFFMVSQLLNVWLATRQATLPVTVLFWDESPAMPVDSAYAALGFKVIYAAQMKPICANVFEVTS